MSHVWCQGGAASHTLGSSQACLPLQLFQHLLLHPGFGEWEISRLLLIKPAPAHSLKQKDYPDALPQSHEIAAMNVKPSLQGQARIHTSGEGARSQQRSNTRVCRHGSEEVELTQERTGHAAVNTQRCQSHACDSARVHLILFYHQQKTTYVRRHL